MTTTLPRPNFRAAWSLIGDQLDDPYAGWTIGTYGAIAEFVRDPDEPVELSHRDVEVTVSTNRGAIRLQAHPQLVPVAYERAVGAEQHWNHTVALCLPEAAARMSGRSVITELGPDHDAIRPEDRTTVLFDLGLNAPHVDVCVRTADPHTIEALRAAEGRPLLDPSVPAAATLTSTHPHRVLISRCGRIEVFTPIPPPDGAAPEGPHTHLLPALLARGRTHAHTEPIPGGWLPAASVVPAQAIVDIMGRPIPFDRHRYDRFQQLLRDYGDPADTDAKFAVLKAILAGTGPDAVPSASLQPRAAALAMRQAVSLGADPKTIEAWARHLRWARSAPRQR